MTAKTSWRATVAVLWASGNRGRGMISTPRQGLRVQIWYRKRLRAVMAYHSAIGTVVVVGRGRPRSHGIDVGGRFVVVPAGNLRYPKIQEGGDK